MQTVAWSRNPVTTGMLSFGLQEHLTANWQGTGATAKQLQILVSQAIAAYLYSLLLKREAHGLPLPAHVAEPQQASAEALHQIDHIHAISGA